MTVWQELVILPIDDKTADYDLEKTSDQNSITDNNMELVDDEIVGCEKDS